MVSVDDVGAEAEACQAAVFHTGGGKKAEQHAALAFYLVWSYIFESATADSGRCYLLCAI